MINMLPRLIIVLILTFVLTRAIRWVFSRWLTDQIEAWVTFVLSLIISFGLAYYVAYVRRYVIVMVLCLVGWLTYELYRARRRKKIKREPFDLDPDKRVYPPNDKK